jgi:drug/metabolite transporter (DMT)-like permease
LFWGGGGAGLVLFGAASLQQVGLVHTTAGKAGFITGLYVILVPLVGFLRGHRTGPGAWGGATLAALGLYLLSVREGLSLDPGDAWVLGSAFLWTAHVLVLAWFAPRLDGIHLAFIQFLVCAGCSLICAAFTETISWDGVRGAAIPILYGGGMSVGVAYTLQVVAQREAPPAHAAIILSLEAVFAAAAGWVLLDESLSTRGMVGCALMLAGMLVSQIWLRPRFRSPERPECGPNPPPHLGKSDRIGWVGPFPDHQEGIRCKAPRSDE